MNNRAFTYIEILIALAVMAVLFVPIMQLFSHTVYSVSASQDLITATNLAKWEMERIRNLNLTKAQLKEAGDRVYPPEDSPPLEMNSARWRIKAAFASEEGPLEARVSVFREEAPDKPVITLVTLIEDMTWEKIKTL
jgi:prepilin-type N-terminal cleavage/methylation domain-containing protein